MKKTLIPLIVMAAAAIASVSCNKEEPVAPDVQEGGIPFEFYAKGISSKTTNEGLATHWSAGDKVNLFHADAGSTTYISDGAFTTATAGASVTFTGELASAVTNGSKYDWYAIYPYNSNITTPANTGTKGYVTVGSSKSGHQTQTGNSNKDHIAGTNYPIAGAVKNVTAPTTPSITMSHLTTLMEVKVKNGTTSPITVSEISFTGTEDIVGTYYIDFVSNPVVYTSSGATYVGNKATLQVSGGTDIAANATATFYLAVKPFTAPASGTLTIDVTANNGTQSRNKVLASATSFVAGKINTLNFTYDKTVPAYDELNLIWTGVSGSTYSSWTKDGLYSGVSYSGSSAGGNDAIQLRSNSNSGIVSTTSDRYFTKVAVAWNESTASGRKLNVYGKNVPYSATSELYDANTQGDLIGTIVCGTSTELSIPNYYEYIGLRSEDGAMYLDEIDIYSGAAKTKVSAPTGVSAAVSGTAINVNWTDVATNVGSYIVTCTGQAPKVISQGVQAASFTGLTNGSYSVTVQAVPTDVTLATGTYAYSTVSTVSGLEVTAAAVEVWKETALASIGASDVFVIVGTLSNTNYVMTNANGTSSAPTATSVTIAADGKITDTVLDTWKWNVSGNSTDGYTFYPNGSTTTWLYCNTSSDSGSNNNMRVGTGSRNVFELNASNYLVTKDTNVARYVCVYATGPDWRGYVSGSTSVKFYVKQ